MSTLEQGIRTASKSYERGHRFKLRPSSLTALAAILGLILMVAGCILAHQGGLLNLLYPLGTLLVGVLLYLRHPVLYVGFVWWIWFLTPEVRRLVDYQSGWHPQSTIMLAPYLVAGLTLFTLLRHSPKLQVFPLLPIGMACAGLLYAFGVGALKVGISPAAFDTLTWLVPVLVAFYFMVHWRSYPDFRRLTRRVFYWGVLVMGLYGVLQFLNPPAWDRFWMINVPMGSIGLPEPFEVRVFSTLNSPGPFAVVMMAGLLVLLGGGGLRNWPAISAGYAGFLLSLVRSAWSTWLVGLLFLVAQGGRSRPRLLVTLLATVLIVWPLLSFGPIGDVIDQRLQTFSRLEQDTSFVERLRLYSDMAPQAFSEVWGQGMGSTGVATKLSNAGDLGELGDFDSGIMAIPLTLGWPGSLLFVGGLVWLLLYALRGVKRSDVFATACRAVVVAMLMQFVFGNSTTGVSGMVLWGFLGLAAAAQIFHARSSVGDVGRAAGSPGRPVRKSASRATEPLHLRGSRSTPRN